MTVTLNMKIADVLKQHPELFDVLVAQSSHFQRLKNPILRRIHGRLVTVAQAAAIAGIEPAQLVRRLNAAIGEDVAVDDRVELRTASGGTPPPWVGSAVVAAEVDAREDQRSHQDPFTRIMAAVAKVGDGEVLLLRNTFEPLPLYDVLGKRGFVAWARQLAPEDWEVYFCKVGRLSGNRHDEAQSNGASPADKPALVDGEQPVATITVDVRDLVPPQPMMRILEALDRLQPGETLLVHHVRRPVYLYPRLAELGYRHETRDLGPDRVDIVIYR